MNRAENGRWKRGYAAGPDLTRLEQADAGGARSAGQAGREARGRRGAKRGAGGFVPGERHSRGHRYRAFGAVFVGVSAWKSRRMKIKAASRR